MLRNAYLLAKIGSDTAENEQTFAEHLMKFRDVTPPDVEAERGDPPAQDGTPRALQPHLLEATSGLGPFENDNQRM